MKTSAKLLFILGILFISYPWVGAQQQEKLSLNSGTLENQFNYVIRKSSKFEDSRVVKTWWLTSLRSHVLDSIQALQNELIESNQNSSRKSTEIDSLLVALQSTSQDLDKAVKAKNSLTLLGIDMNKTIYNTIVWVLIGGLLFLSSILFFIYKRSHLVTSRTKTDLEGLKEEYESHKIRAREREEKRVRELYDEILKYKKKVNS